MPEMKVTMSIDTTWKKEVVVDYTSWTTMSKKQEKVSSTAQVKSIAEKNHIEDRNISSSLVIRVSMEGKRFVLSKQYPNGMAGVNQMALQGTKVSNEIRSGVLKITQDRIDREKKKVQQRYQISQAKKKAQELQQTGLGRVELMKKAKDLQSQMKSMESYMDMADAYYQSLYKYENIQASAAKIEAILSREEKKLSEEQIDRQAGINVLKSVASRYGFSVY